MSLTFSTPKLTEMKPRIVVLGVGGAGGNAVNNMIRSDLQGVEFVVANTDAQALSQSDADLRIQLGLAITEGLGAGARPEIGQAAAEDTIPEIEQCLQNSHMAFIAAGMGGGTGTGAAPVIARVARDLGILTIGIVTRPFQFEGSKRALLADRGIEELQEFVDTLIIIPNQNLFRIANEDTTFADAFKMADQVLDAGVRGITDLMVNPGIINLDFADVKTVMGEMGKAMMGTGRASGDRRAVEAAEAAISNPLLDDVTMHGARGVLINIIGGADLTLFEVDEAANRIRSEVAQDANIIVGSTFEQELDGEICVSVVATGIEGDTELLPKLKVVADSSTSDGDEDGEGGEAVEDVDLPGIEAWDEGPTVQDGMALPGAPVMQFSETDPDDAPHMEMPATDIEAPSDAGMGLMGLPREFINDYAEVPDPVAEEEADASAFASDLIPADPFFAEPPVSVEDVQRYEQSDEIEADATEAKRPGLWNRIMGHRLSRRSADDGNSGNDPIGETDTDDDQLSMFGAGSDAADAHASRRGGRLVTSADRLTVSYADENHLEIPAFLRRQVN